MLEQLAKMSSAPAGAEAKETVELSKQAHAVRLGFKWEDDEDHAVCMNATCSKTFGLFRRRFVTLPSALDNFLVS